jgi:hypothetical protein
MIIKSNPHISGFIEYYPPEIETQSPYIVNFVMDNSLRFVPVWILADKRLEQIIEGGEGDY